MENYDSVPTSGLAGRNEASVGRSVMYGSAQPMDGEMSTSSDCPNSSRALPAAMATPSPRQQLRLVRIDEAEVQRLDTVALRSRVLEQARCLRDVTVENANLAAVLDGSADARDTLVAQLRRQVAQLQQRDDVRDVQRGELLRQLQGTPQVNMSTDQNQHTAALHLGSAINKLSVSEGNTGAATTRALLRANEHLRTELADKDETIRQLVAEIARWQRHASERDQYATRVEGRGADLDRLVSTSSGGGGGSGGGGQERLDQLSLGYKQRLQELAEQKQQVEAACHALRRRAEQAEQKLATATAATAGPDASCVAHGDTIVALRRSIDMMHDDFAAEQRDHQGALATIALLQDEMELYKTQVAQFQEDAMETLHQRREQSRHNQFVYDPYQCDSGTGDGLDEIDSMTGGAPVQPLKKAAAYPSRHVSLAPNRHFSGLP